MIPFLPHFFFLALGLFVTGSENILLLLIKSVSFFFFQGLVEFF